MWIEEYTKFKYNNEKCKTLIDINSGDFGGARTYDWDKDTCRVSGEADIVHCIDLVVVIISFAL